MTHQIFPFSVFLFCMLQTQLLPSGTNAHNVHPPSPVKIRVTSFQTHPISNPSTARYLRPHYNSRRRCLTFLPSFPNDDNDSEYPSARKRGKLLKPFRKAVQKFKDRPVAYLLIPFIAALVGWFTNWLAVQMIFYPIKFRGIPIYRIDEAPLGLLGWHGIVPCKTRPMSEAMVHMVTTQLLSVPEVFLRLEPAMVAHLLNGEMPKLVNGVMDDFLVPPSSPMRWLLSLPPSSFLYDKFLRSFTVAMQNNIDSVLNLKSCVVNQMMTDRSLLGKLFQKCGQKELDFLTNSGLWFGFLLGIIQMIVALFWDNPWSLSIGGCIVGFATNWLALKWIFEPVNPTKFGPFILQGQFLRRQKEVASEFSNFFANKILTSEKLWTSILTDPDSLPAFQKLFHDVMIKFLRGLTLGLPLFRNSDLLTTVTEKTTQRLLKHVPVLHSYVDKELMLQDTLRTSMELMTSAQFERVLHPIFEEDELTLVLAGAVLGFAAGLIQQGIETGKLRSLSPKQVRSCLNLKFKRIQSSTPVRMVRNYLRGLHS